MERPPRSRSRNPRYPDEVEEEIPEEETSPKPAKKSKSKPKIEWNLGEEKILMALMKKYPKLAEPGPIPQEVMELLPRHPDSRAIKQKARVISGIAFASKNAIGIVFFYMQNARDLMTYL